MKSIYKILFIVWLLAIQSAPLIAKTIKGKVACNGKGLSKVVVTDGTNFAQTNSKGDYKLDLLDTSRFVYISTPSGYLPQVNGSSPLFYQLVEVDKNNGYDFNLVKNTVDDSKHTLLVHADAQLFKQDNLIAYNKILDDCITFIQEETNGNVFGIDCGDIVGDKPELFPHYISSQDRMNVPFYRAMGNHDMKLYGRSNESSYQTFEDTFGPAYYSFNRGNVHYVVLNDVFYLARDYFYAGYIDERQLAWLEKDLSYVPDSSLVMVAMHIPTRLEVGSVPFEYSNANVAGRVSNAPFLYEILKPYNAHILSGHTHYNDNLIHADNLYEHITAATCGTWWQGDVCLDGTPLGYGVYQIDGNQVEWFFKSAGYPKEYQMRVYAPGASKNNPEDLIANVWNWDKDWQVIWLEDGKVMGEMERITLCDPAAELLCNDKEKLEFPWISATPNKHMFRATPQNKSARMEVQATDRFGHIYKSGINFNTPLTK